MNFVAYYVQNKLFILIKLYGITCKLICVTTLLLNIDLTSLGQLRNWENWGLFIRYQSYLNKNEKIKLKKRDKLSNTFYQ